MHGSSFGHVPDWVHYAARVAPHVVVPAPNLHEGDVLHDASLGNEGEGGGVVLQSVETNASLAS